MKKNLTFWSHWDDFCTKFFCWFEVEEWSDGVGVKIFEIFGRRKMDGMGSRPSSEKVTHPLPLTKGRSMFSYIGRFVSERYVWYACPCTPCTCAYIHAPAHMCIHACTYMHSATFMKLFVWKKCKVICDIWMKPKKRPLMKKSKIFFMKPTHIKPASSHKEKNFFCCRCLFWWVGTCANTWIGMPNYSMHMSETRRNKNRQVKKFNG